jgi:hypothetical protein
MNFNHLNAPHLVDQHGLWIKPTNVGYSFASSLGPPKNVDSVNISIGAEGFRTIMRGTRKEITNDLNSTVAHELGHAVHIRHHGDGDKVRSWDYEIAFNMVNGTFDIDFTENSQGVIYPKWENDNPFTENLMGNLYVAVWGGQHSGLDDCIMRYDCAEAYIPLTGTTGTRYVVRGDERIGLTLCDQKEDVPGGVNDLSRKPRSRYGSAVRGNCKSQICVNDKYH